ncbi:MAG: helix-turn-helix domain-containing protein [Deferribacteraceae bacterium]|jgi:transcriptional regulator with XRE-family HTH domain|nr:helix-turn-helix domain-containing protein [Deferribacteraceae bacterium]
MNTIKKLRIELELTQKEFATRLGVTSHSVQNWENGRSYPSHSTIEHISRIFKVSKNSLLMDNDEPIVSHDNDSEFADLSESVAKHFGISKVEIVKMKGDSMEPKYANGDMLFVDRDDNKFTSEGIYAIVYMGTLVVKCLQRIQNGVRIRAYNKQLYDDIDMSSERFAQDDIVIVGKVKGAITLN